MLEISKGSEEKLIGALRNLQVTGHKLHAWTRGLEIRLERSSSAQ